MQQEGDNSEAPACGAVFNHFGESGELLSLVRALPQVCGELRSREKSEERFTSILDKYQEQPHLLDPHLESLVNQLFLLTQPDVNPLVKQQAFRCLYVVSKVRGPKVMVRWFPHEVRDFDPVLTLLQQQDAHDHETWETRYILLLWLSFLLMMPFDLSRMDGSMNGPGLGTIDRVFEVTKFYLGVSDKCRDSAAILLARLVTRPDVKILKLDGFMSWTLDVLDTADKSGMSDTMLLSGVLWVLCLVFKHGKREDVKVWAPKVLSRLGRCSQLASSDTHIRKLCIKLVHWLGVTFLPPRVAKWRYQRGGRSLEEALATPTSLLDSQQGAGEEGEDEEYEVPPELEEVLGMLLSALRDRDTIVRWTAAKGVGKVTGRLPVELADEVLQSLLQLFISREDDSAWHGGCLALAELGRRGLLLPQRLSDVVPVVMRALTYEERRGVCSVGAHVRDAGCYVCWAFARAYQPQHLQPYVTDIASGLLVVMLFDREVNCRRAASAAFQENVGRQGTFPHGIDILTAADYFAVGNISNAYLNVSMQVAKFPEYTRHLIHHLHHYKLLHWDSTVRELAGKALRNITSLDPLHVRDTVLPSLLPLVTSSDFCLRHGALHAVAEISRGLYQVALLQGHSFSDYVGEHTIQGLLQVAPRLQQANVFRGAVGEVMRPAALNFIEQMCVCGLPAIAADPVIDTWQVIVEANLPHVEEKIRACAVSAFCALCGRYYSSDSATIHSMQERLIPTYTSHLLSHSHLARMGFSLALGGFPRPLLAGRLRDVLDSLMRSCKDRAPQFAEARRDAVLSITRICSTVVMSTGSCDAVPGSCDAVPGSCDLVLSASDVDAVFATFLGCLGDYTMDSRGDVGAGVREAAMAGISSLLGTLAAHNTHLLSPQVVSQALCGLVQQASEKIDRTRAMACEALVGVVFHDLALPHIPHHSGLQQLFKDAVTEDTNWSSPHLSFPLTVQLLGMPTYLCPALLGLLVSVGGLTESTVRHSSSALLRYLQNISADEATLSPFTDALLKIFSDNSGDSRVMLPLLKTLDLLLSNGIFDVYLSIDKHPFPVSLLVSLNREVKSCKEPVLLLSSVTVFCGLLQFPSTRHSALNRIMLFLCHNFPRVRKSTADQFYVTLLTFDDLLESTLTDEVMECLSETAWDGPIAGVREKRNGLCAVLKLPVPKLVTKSAAQKKTRTSKDELSSYKDLVERAGY